MITLTYNIQIRQIPRDRKQDSGCLGLKAGEGKGKWGASQWSEFLFKTMRIF